MNTSTLEFRNLTEVLNVPFANEDWDYPEDVPGYGVADWLNGSEALLVYNYRFFPNRLYDFNQVDEPQVLLSILCQ